MSVLSDLAAAHAQAEPAPKAKEKVGKSEISKPATKADRFEQLRLLEKSLNKQFDTTGSIQILGKRLGLDIPVISTQLPSLDYGVLECGGVPRGRIVEVYGPESCLDSNTHIHYTINKDGKRINHKGGTIKKLYERFHKTNTHHLATNENVSFTAPCVNEEGRIFHNKIMDVVFTGRKPVYKITTKKGHTINATAEHKFFNGDKWIPLADLSSGDVLMIHDKTRFTCEYPDRINRQYVFVKNHKVAGIKEIFDKKTGNTYVYHRLVKSRAAVEANMNGLSYEAYIERLNQGDIDDLAALPRDWHVHHVDEDCTNDNISNLVILNPTEHGRLHAIDRHNNLRYTIVEDIVESIAYVDYTDTYDVKMLSPFNNYIANNFVVHNSGKTTFCLHLVACEQQTTDNIVAYVDAEHALDINYAAKLGVNVNELLIAQPDSGEQALETVEALVESKIVSLIIIDSVAALVPRAELEGEMGDSAMGLHARLMSQAMRKLRGKASENGVTLIFINQIREKIGTMFGNPEVTTGGRALKFFASVRLDVRRRTIIGEKDSPLGHELEIKATKNKVGSPMRSTLVRLIYGLGIEKETDFIEYAVKIGAMSKTNNGYYSFGEKKIGQGLTNVCECVRLDTELRKAIVDKMTEIRKAEK